MEKCLFCGEEMETGTCMEDIGFPCKGEDSPPPEFYEDDGDIDNDGYVPVNTSFLNAFNKAIKN